MKSYSMVVTTLVLVAGTCVPAMSLQTVAQATASGPEAQRSASLARADSGEGTAGQSVKAAIPPVKAALPAAVLSSPLTPGVPLVVELERTLNAKKLKRGDKIKAILTQDLVLQGKIVAPEESMLVGHVTEARGATDEDPTSRLGFVFDRILLKHHQELDFLAVVQAVARPAPRRSKVDEPSQMMPPSFAPSRNQGTGAMGAPGPTRGGTGNSRPSSGQTGPSSVASTPINVPVTVRTDTAPAVNVAVNTGKPISAGLPQGVFGLAGLALSVAPTEETPGPVIVSKSGSVKLEYGTQVLLRIAGPPLSLPQAH